MTTIISNSRAAGTPEPFATSTTTPPRDTFEEVTVTPGDGVLMYWPEKNGFLALFSDEYRVLFAEAEEHSRKIERLQSANRNYTEAALTLREAHKGGVVAEIAKAEASLRQAINEMHLASKDVKKTLEPLGKLDAKDSVKIIELVSLKKSKEKKSASNLCQEHYDPASSSRKADLPD